MAVVLDASLEVRSAVLYGSLIVMLVFLPVFMLQGLAGAFFRPLALAYVLAILASLAVALTVTPALSLLLLRSREDRGDARAVAALKERYRRMLRVRRPAPRRSAPCDPLLPHRRDSSFLGGVSPNFREYDFSCWVGSLPPSKREARDRARRAGLLAVPGAQLRRPWSRGSRGKSSVDLQLWISLDPSVDCRRPWRISRSTGTPGSIGISDLPARRIRPDGRGATIVVRVYGPDLELRSQAQSVSAAIADIEGVVDLKVRLSARSSIKSGFAPIAGRSSASRRGRFAARSRRSSGQGGGVLRGSGSSTSWCGAS
jgi:hypothetical protein